MPRPSIRHARPASPTDFRGLVLALAFTTLPSLAVAAPAPPSAQGDPDIPAAIEPLKASRSILGRDFSRLASSASLRLLVTGSVLALAVQGEESPDRAEVLLDRSGFDGGLDAGTVYGHGATLAGGALGLLAVGWLADDPNLEGAGSEMVRSLAYTGVVVTALKMGVGRARPNGGRWSFPSGHTAAAFSVAPILSHRFGRAVAIPAYTIALATGLGRMEDRKHYLSDVLVGAAIGLSIGRAVAGPDGGGGPSIGFGAQGLAVTAHF